MSFVIIIGIVASIVTIAIGIFNAVHIIHTHPNPDQTKRIIIVTASIVVFIIIGSIIASSILGRSSMPSPTTSGTATVNSEICSGTNGVTLYVEPGFKGHCHTFPPGSYDLEQYGLDGNVSSLRDPGAKYHVTLHDKSGRPGYFDKDELTLPADWIDQAHTLLVELH